MRKVEEGKNKMSVINAVRNKLIHILLACVRKSLTKILCLSLDRKIK